MTTQGMHPGPVSLFRHEDSKRRDQDTGDINRFPSPVLRHRYYPLQGGLTSMIGSSSATPFQAFLSLATGQIAKQ
jgi:hypothetical protein